MVTAKCSKCGTVHRYDDDDVPPSGMVVKCTGCTAPVTVMPAGAAAMGFGDKDDSGLLELGDDDVVELGGDESPAFTGAAADLSTLPAPRRPSPLAGAPAKPAPSPVKSPLAGVTPPGRPTGIPEIKPLGNLPAPKQPRTSTELGTGPDLPAPRGGISDLPAPRGGISDLPSPVGGISDLPAPKTRPPGKPVRPDNLPSPVGGISDLPAPKTRPPGKPVRPDNLPSPVGGISDLPAPKSPGADLPAPKSTGAAGPLAAPDSFFDDDTPTRGGDDVSVSLDDGIELGPLGDDDFGDGIDIGGTGIDAPAGGDPFADGIDLGAPGADRPPADDPFAGGLDLGGSGDAGADDPFAGGLELGAPGKDAPPADDPFAGGLDLGGSGDSGAGTSDPFADSLDLGAPGKEAPPTDDPFAGGLDLGGSGDAGDPFVGGLELGGDSGPDLGGSGAGQSDPFADGLDLGTPGKDAPPADDPFAGGIDLAGGDGGADGGDPFAGGIDLAAPSVGPGASPAPIDLGGSGGGAPADDVVTFSKPTSSGAARPSPGPGSPLRRGQRDEGADLELDLDPGRGPKVAKPVSGDPAVQAAKKSASKDAEAAGKKRQKVLAGALVGVALLGGGYFAYSHFSAEEAQTAQIGAEVQKAEAALAADHPGHWNEAIQIAQGAAQRAGDDGSVFAIQAEAHFALFADTGRDRDANLTAGNQALADARSRAYSGVHMQKADGLQALAERRFADAAAKLSQLSGENPNDASAALYLGWALSATDQPEKAAAAYQKALSLRPDHVAALYGLGLSQLALEQGNEATETFEKVIAVSRERHKTEHVGALIGVAQLAKVDRFSDRENRYLEILENEAVKTGRAPPREVSRAWALAGDEALRGGRVGVASERYDKATALHAANLRAIVGQAKVERDRDRPLEAIEKLDQVLQLSPNHVDALLTKAEIALDQGKADDAANLLATVLERQPPVTRTADLARMELLKGKIFAADPDSAADAEAALKKAIELSGDDAIGPTLALAEFYVEQQRGDEAVALLEPVRNAAMEDPALAVTLGIAYLGAGDAESAIAFFQRAVELRPEDVEALSQLGRALFVAERPTEAIQTLRSAFEASDQREDIGLELADALARIGKNRDAGEVYETVLAGDEPTITARGIAGRFFARTGDTVRAEQIGDEILKVDPKNPAGHFLKGIALLAQEDPKKARESLGEAITLDPQAQYLEAAARASEALDDYEDALHNFGRAITADPYYLAPRIGRARIRVRRREYPLALEELMKAREVAKALPDTEENRELRAQLVAMEGETYLEMRDYAKAVEALRAAAQADPKSGRTYFLLGKAHDNLGQYRDAARAYGSAARVADDRSGNTPAWLPDAYRALGYAIRSGGGSKSAQKKAFQRYLDLAPVKSEATSEVERLLLSL